jgi:hypothetical protein
MAWCRETHALTAARKKREAAEMVLKYIMANTSEQLRPESLEHGCGELLWNARGDT